MIDGNSTDHLQEFDIFQPKVLFMLPTLLRNSHERKNEALLDLLQGGHRRAGLVGKALEHRGGPLDCKSLKFVTPFQVYLLESGTIVI